MAKASAKVTKISAKREAEEKLKEELAAQERANAIAEGRRKSGEALEYLLERINVAQRLETFLDKLEFEQLVKLEDGIKAIKDKKRREAEAERLAAAEREKIEQQIRELAAKHGIDVELKGSAAVKKKRKGVDPERYAVKFEDTGNIYYWSGMGHPPKAFKHALEKGFKKEALLKPASGNVFSISKEPK